MAKMPSGNRTLFWNRLPDKARKHLRQYLVHPEVFLFNPEINRGEWMV
jgi:hypothetical protein